MTPYIKNATNVLQGREKSIDIETITEGDDDSFKQDEGDSSINESPNKDKSSILTQ